MRIVIDGRMYKESGIGRYIRNLIYNLQILDRENEYFILHKQPEYDRLVYHTNFHKVLANFKWYGISEQIGLPRILNKLKPDLVHFPHFNVPIFYNGKFVVTIHDLIHQHFQMRRASTLNPLIYKVKHLGYTKVFKAAVTKSVKVLVPSEYVKQLLVSEWKLKPRKIIVTYEAVDDKIIAIASKMKQEDINKVLGKFTIKSPYIFYVGNAHPHKNVEGLIKEFLLLKRKHKELNLVLSGADHYFWQRIKKEYPAGRAGKDGGIIYTDYVTDEELMALYKNATCFVMPSFEEGFGIPILEAFSSECPVVSSNAGALPEIGGDAAIYFNPKDMEDMINKISQVLNDEKLRKGLIEKGKKRVKFFSWEKLARQTMEVYRKCL